MSRQPYLPAYSRFHFTIAHTSLADRPELASILGQCLGVWEQAETLLGLCLSITAMLSTTLFIYWS